MTDKTVIGFDLYGTLLSTESIAQELAKIYHDENLAKELAAQWRRYQLEYTWRANSMGIYRPFSELTLSALKHATAEKGLPLDDASASRLISAYNGLDTFPEVQSALDTVANAGASVDAYIFSNGTDDMVSASMRTSPTLSKMSHVFSGENGKLVTVEAVERFKPDPKVYQYLAGKAGCVLSNVWVVSANPFDVVGARAVGAQAAWIDRAGTGWVDALGSATGVDGPSIVARGVDEAVKAILERSTTV